MSSMVEGVRELDRQGNIIVATRGALRAMTCFAPATLSDARAPRSRVEAISALFMANYLLWNVASRGKIDLVPVGLAKQIADRVSRVGPALGKSESVAWNVGGCVFEAIQLLAEPDAGASFSYYMGSSKAYRSNKAKDLFLNAADEDIEGLHLGKDIIHSSLWRNEEPEQSRFYWLSTRRSLIDMDANWSVWTNWFEAKLAGLESQLDNHFFDVVEFVASNSYSSATLNEYISSLVVENKVLNRSDNSLRAVENIPSAVGFIWSGAEQITIAPGDFQPSGSLSENDKRNHNNRLGACLAIAEDIVEDLSSKKFNVRIDFEQHLRRYHKRLPRQSEEGNILLADAEARNIRNMFESDLDALPTGFASQLKTFLEQHIGLRVYYPEIEHFYRDVRNGHISAPLPIDAVEGVSKTISEYTPELFHDNVSKSIDDAEISITSSGTREAEEHVPAQIDSNLVPPIDPLGKIKSSDAADYTKAGIVNRLWLVLTHPEKIELLYTRWKKLYDTLYPNAKIIIDWLRTFVSS